MTQGQDLSKIVSIAEAAQLLGVSERTIYRRVKLGQILRVNLSDNRVKVEVFYEEEAVSEPVKVSDIVPESRNADIALLRAEVQSRDAQIESLIANQREMNQTIQQLNQQIYELARLVFTSESEKNEKKAGKLSQWLNKWKPSPQEKSKS